MVFFALSPHEFVPDRPILGAPVVLASSSFMVSRVGVRGLYASTSERHLPDVLERGGKQALIGIGLGMVKRMRPALWTTWPAILSSLSLRVSTEALANSVPRGCGAGATGRAAAAEIDWP